MNELLESEELDEGTPDLDAGERRPHRLSYEMFALVVTNWPPTEGGISGPLSL
jgi:hypothetical protein